LIDIQRLRRSTTLEQGKLEVIVLEKQTLRQNDDLLVRLLLDSINGFADKFSRRALEPMFAEFMKERLR